MFNAANEKKTTVLVGAKQGVTMECAIFLSLATGHKLVSNRRLQKELNGGEGWKAVKRAFPCWTGTFFAYDLFRQKNGETIEYTQQDSLGMRYVYRVPKELQDRHSFLLTEPIHYDLEVDGKTIVIHTRHDEIELPAWICDDGRPDKRWYSSSEYGTPIRPTNGIGQDAVFLGPLERKAVGLAHRNERYLGLHSRNAGELGVIIEAEDTIPELNVQFMDSGVYMEGIDWERIRTLCRNDASPAEISEMIPAERLTAIRQLMPALEEHGYRF
ncbi:MAG: hypothetical protein V1827_05595 [Candidatus Micrarchaeota archaeon]